MTPDPQAIQALFARAIEIMDRAEREKFLTEQCGGDSKLYERIANLLIAFDGSKGFLDQPTQAHAAQHIDAVSRYQPGNMIAGRYKLLEAIGEGGMGTVWVAEQSQPVRRKVALKLVKPGMDSKQVLARFDAERQALALMDHPNIAKVFDGGVTDQGRPFFAMELVKGMPLTEYCDQMRLSVEERLRLFVPICQAVQHAHQKGIIHRDLKPSNVLICLYDGKPVPKVIDFGLAKAMHQPLTEQTVHTGFGLMIGTPLYMSPEQAEHNNLDVDTRTDVYSLGVMLYELLTGSTPLEKAQFKEAAFGEILRLIKEVEPPKPSTRVSSSAQLPNIAAQRNLDPNQLGRSIRGDLDWIVMKSIEKERERRYDTANGLARDIERFLNLEAVEACPPSTSYRLRRLARKHSAIIGTASAFAMILILGAGLSIWQAFRATKAESLASRRLMDVQAEQLKTQDALKTSQESERRALESESAAVAAREAEAQAKTAETQQRELAVLQRDEAKRLQSEATAKSSELQVLTEEQRRVIYVSEMNQVRLEAQRGNPARMREILLEQLPIDGKEDLRGFEWNYWYRYLNQAKALNKFDKATVDARGSALVTVLPGGRQVAWTQGKTTELVELQDGTSRRLPFQLRHYVDRTRFANTGRAVIGACLSHTYPLDTNYTTPGSDQGSSTTCSVVEPTGQVHTFTYPADGFKHISALDISRDGTHVVVIGYDASHSKENAATRICVWNVDSKQLILNEVYEREINRVSFSPDGKKIAAHLCHGTMRYSDDRRDVVVIVDIATSKEMAVLQHDDDIDSLFWIPGSDRVLLSTLGFSGANRKQLLSWRTEKVDSRPVLLSKETMPDYANGVVSPDGSTLAITSHVVNNIRLFDTTRGDLIDTLQTDGKGIASIAYTDDGRQLLATTVKSEVLKWNLGEDRDLFALRSKPLPRLTTNGYLLSQDQSLLAIVLADGTLLTRTRDGVETQLKQGSPIAEIGSVQMKISPDNTLLAFRTNVGLDGKLLSAGKGLLDVYDLVGKRRLWQTNCTTLGGGAVIADHIMGTRMEFSADGQKLVHVSGSGDSHVYDARTGKGTALDLRENGTYGSYVMMRRNPASGGLFAAFMETRPGEGIRHSAVFDPVSGKKTFSFPIGRPGMAIPAPDGEHLAVFESEQLQIWNLAKSEKVVSASGLPAFSPDSRRFATLAITPATANTIDAVEIWDLSGRRKLYDLPLAGDLLDDVRFSPDGKRLLTFEGKGLASSKKLPRGRLWDVETGREILDFPVAEVNHYDWDLFFDVSGQQITQLLFTKSMGTIGGGATALFDARPLEPSVDNELAADRLIALLSSKLGLKREWIADIESRTGLKPGIRDVALTKIRDSIVDPEKLANLIGEIVSLSKGSPIDYQKAITWAEELNRLQPNSFRSRALLGAAYYRTDRIDDALHVLTDFETKDIERRTDIDKGFDKVRRAVLSLVQLRFGKKREAQKTLEEASKLPNAVPSRFANTIFVEATTLVPARILPTDPELMEKEDAIKKVATGILSRLGSEELELAKFPGGTGHRLVTYDGDHNHRIKTEELCAAIKDMHRFGRQISTKEGLFSVDSQLEFLDETIVEAPQYLTARFARAWIRATCPDSQFRDAEKALEDAKAICEKTNYLDATFLEALAAAYAASDDFSSAIRWQKEANRLHQESGLLHRQYYADSSGRLSTYENHKTCSSKLPLLGDVTVAYAPKVQREQEASVPCFAPDTVTSFRRIAGTGAAWSPDGTKIVRNIKSSNATVSPLEWIDLISGETQLVCTDGTKPVWIEKPSEQIYFARGPQGDAPLSASQSIWQCDPSGHNPKRFMDGSSPSFLKDGQLMVTLPKGSPAIAILKSFQFNQAGEWVDSGLEFEVAYSAHLSPDGKLIAESGNDLTIRDVVSKAVLHSFNVGSRMFGTVDGAWSPDSRYFAYASVKTSKASGVWIMDVTTGENRQLVDIDATKPKWSHDGRFIAADERGKDQIVILDVSSLHLENGFGNTIQQTR